MMGGDVTLSVLIVTYNQATFVGQSLDGVLAQARVVALEFLERCTFRLADGRALGLRAQVTIGHR